MILTARLRALHPVTNSPDGAPARSRRGHGAPPYVLSRFPRASGLSCCRGGGAGAVWAPEPCALCTAKPRVAPTACITLARGRGAALHPAFDARARAPRRRPLPPRGPARRRARTQRSLHRARARACALLLATPGNSHTTRTQPARAEPTARLASLRKERLSLALSLYAPSQSASNCAAGQTARTRRRPRAAAQKLRRPTRGPMHALRAVRGTKDTGAPSTCPARHPHPGPRPLGAVPTRAAACACGRPRRRGRRRQAPAQRGIRAGAARRLGPRCAAGRAAARCFPTHGWAAALCFLCLIPRIAANTSPRAHLRALVHSCAPAAAHTLHARTAPVRGWARAPACSRSVVRDRRPPPPLCCSCSGPHGCARSRVPEHPLLTPFAM